MKYQPKRECGDCTVCCEGHLTANIHGHEMHPGKPCHFVDNRDRPKNICAAYKCAWLSDPDGGIPEWMKPNLSGALITDKNWDNGFYWSIAEVTKYDPSVLYWIISFTEQRNIPLEIQINGVIHHRGPREFMEFISNLRK